VLALLAAGNLALSQAVVNALAEGAEDGGGSETLASVPSMFRAAQLVGAVTRRVFRDEGEALKAQNVPFDVSFLLGGQIAGGPMRLFQIYAAGNFIEAGPDMPFLQIGEHKYGKPILDRALGYETDLRDAIKLVLISMDSTLRSNLTVGLPMDLLVARAGALQVETLRRIGDEDPYFRMIRERWSAALREAYQAIPAPPWQARDQCAPASGSGERRLHAPEAAATVATAHAMAAPHRRRATNAPSASESAPTPSAPSAPLPMKPSE
jgi:putative proteasome-type protease